MRNHRYVAWLTLLAAVSMPCFGAEEPAGEKKPPAVYPVAVLPFREHGSGVKGYGLKVSNVLFASLAANENLYLVDRVELTKLLAELELNISGMVKPGEAARIGQLTGAKIIITGSVIEVDRTLYLIAKIIGTETSRVLGESVKGKTGGDLAELVEALGKKVAATVVKKSGKLVATPMKTEDRIKALKKLLGDAKRPSVVVKIAERHVGQATVDPAAQTEVTLYCKGAGFEVYDPQAGAARRADITITGEGFSEFAGRRGNLISVKARLELKAVDRDGKVVATDRQTCVMVDLVEQIAGKAALQQAAAAIAERLLPKLVKK